MTKQTPNTTFTEGVAASRRFAEQATTVTRQATERNMNMSRQLTDMWVASADASLKAAFELQNAAITAGRSLVEATDGTYHTAFEQWTDMVHQAQQATLEAWQAGKRIGEQFQNTK